MSSPIQTVAVSTDVQDKVPLTRSVDLVNKFLSAFEVAQNIIDSKKKIEPVRTTPDQSRSVPGPTSPPPSTEFPKTLNLALSEDIVIPEVQTTIQSLQGQETQESTTISPRSKLASDKNSRRRNKINQSMEFDLKLVTERNRRKRLRLKPVLIEIERNQLLDGSEFDSKLIESTENDPRSGNEDEDLMIEETTFAIDVTTVPTTTSTVSPEMIDTTADTPKNQVSLSSSEVDGNNSGSSKSFNGQSGLESDKEFLIGQILGKNEEKSTTISPLLILPSTSSGMSQNIQSTVSSTTQMSSMSSMPSTVIASQNINLVNGSTIQDPKGLIPSEIDTFSTDISTTSTTVTSTTVMTTSLSGNALYILNSVKGNFALIAAHITHFNELYFYSSDEIIIFRRFT